MDFIFTQTVTPRKVMRWLLLDGSLITSPLLQSTSQQLTLALSNSPTSSNSASSSSSEHTLAGALHRGAEIYINMRIGPQRMGTKPQCHKPHWHSHRAQRPPSSLSLLPLSN